MSRVLLIETDHHLAHTIKDYLAGEGYEVIWHKDPQAAIVSADKEHPEIVILDLILSIHSGIEFLYELRSYPEWQTIPVIIYSNVSETELAISGHGLGHLNITSYLYKPTTKLEDLTHTVKHALAAQAA